MEIKVENGNILVKLPGADDFDVLCEDFEVSKHVDLLTQKETLRFVIHKPYGEKVFEMPRRELAGKNLFSKFLDYGLNVIDCDVTAEFLKYIIFEKEKETVPKYHHRDKGIVKKSDGDEAFLGEHPIGNNLTDQQMQSTYIGDDITPRGSLNAWRKFLTREIVKYPTLCLAMSLGVTAAVSHLLKKNGTFTEVPLWGLIGESSTGKTCSLTMLASAFADPGGLINDFNATTNAFGEMLREGNGAFPFLADEGTYATKLDWDSLLYTLPSGREKRRCKSDGTLKDKVRASGALIVTSENSLLERTQMLPGQCVRILEFSYRWFKDGNHADRVKGFCIQNYGHLTEPLFSLLVSQGFDKVLRKRFVKFRKTFYSLMDGEPESKERRLIDRYVLILTACWLLEKAIKVDFHKEELLKLLRNHFLEKRQELQPVASEDEKLCQKITAKIAENMSKFPRIKRLQDSRTRPYDHNIWGALDTTPAGNCAWLLPSTLERFVSESGSYGFRKACKILENKGYLKRYQPDRFLFDNIDFGVFKSDAYQFVFKDTPTLLERILSVDASKRTAFEVSKSLNYDKNGAYTPTTDINLNFDYDLPELSLERRGSTLTLILNDRFIQALELEETAYITLIPDRGYLIISKIQITKNDLLLKLNVTKSQAKNATRNVRNLVEMMNLRLENNETILFHGFDFQDYEGRYIAILDYKNFAGIYRYKKLPIAPEERKRSSHLDELLSEDED